MVPENHGPTKEAKPDAKWRTRELLEAYGGLWGALRERVLEPTREVQARGAAMGEVIAHKFSRQMTTSPLFQLLGNVLAVYNQGDRTALKWLARSPFFSQEALFYPERWASLEAAFEDRRGNRFWDVAWGELVESSLFIAIKELSEDTLLPDVYREVRKRVRPHIEKDLLGGKISDEARRHPITPWPDEDTPEALELEAAFQEELSDLWEKIERRIDLQCFLDDLEESGVLHPQMREALELHAYKGLTFKKAAILCGLKPATLRQRLHRVREFVTFWLRGAGYT